MEPTRYIASFSAGRLEGPGFKADCVFGQGGMVAAPQKREGDGATPIGAWPVRQGFYRADRIARPGTRLQLDAITAEDGWCDDPTDRAYNCLIRKPYGASHEDMMRADGVYDLVIVLGHNDDPPRPGAGSAIFVHCWRSPDTPTRGCVALQREALIKLTTLLKPGDLMDFRL